MHYAFAFPASSVGGQSKQWAVPLDLAFMFLHFIFSIANSILAELKQGGPVPSEYAYLPSTGSSPVTYSDTSDATVASISIGMRCFYVQTQD